MKHTITMLLLTIAVAAASQTSDSLRILLNKIVDHAEQASLYRNSVGWDTLKTNVFARAQGAKTVPELGNALRYLLASLGDEHGRIFHNNQVIAYYYGDPKPHQQTFNPDIYSQVQSGRAYAFEAKIIEGNIGYVRIVGLPMGDNNQMTSDIEGPVCEILEKGVDRWIVDLRYNGGGNMFPMAEGLAALIGNGPVGGSAGLTPAENSQWTIQHGDFYYDDYSVSSANQCVATKMPKVAVLTSLYTTSSGEAIAVIFKGRENTRFFGAKTLGMITVTDWTVIDAQTAMTISVSYYKDRNGKVYTQYVEADEEVPFEPKPLSASDIGVQQAVGWLNSNK